jgi:MoaA/NifB/PqqE/SkfB family radical SAM enzyme
VAASHAVDVWYLCDQTLCNFDCPYCSTQASRRSVGEQMWASQDGEQRFHRIVRWLAGLPWRLRIRLQTLGEPFVSKAFLRGAAWLSQQPNIDFVELVTNGSFTKSQFRKWASTCVIDRISLWMTYHHTEIGPGSVVDAAQLAQDAGAFVVVHSLIFPDNLAGIERLVRLCKEKGIRTDVTVGHNFNHAYPTGLLAILETEPNALVSLYRDTAALHATLAAHREPKGQPCSAGHDYIRINSDGSVYPCSPYRQLPDQYLGSALDPDFVPPLRAETYAPCRLDELCGCKEDFFHLEVAHSALRFPRSLGYYEPAPDHVVHVGEAQVRIDLIHRR